jgi:hypothetical protein
MTHPFQNCPVLAGFLLGAGLSCGATAGSPRTQEQTPASTPAFTIAQNDSGSWLVSPQGKPFFSLGVCSVSQGAERQSFDPENPSYAAWQHYASPELWSDATLRRLKAWRFTTLGGWSDLSALRQSREQTLWLTPVLHIGSSAGAPWWDMWEPTVIERMDAVARDQILPLRDDPRLLGYYSDNELGWWNATLWKMTLEQGSASGQRHRLLQLLRESYQGDWTKLLQDFEPEKADNWVSLEQAGMLYLKPGGEGFKVVRRFIGLVAERYYQLVHDIIRKYDTRALILGDRYQSFYYPEVARASANWVDAVSSNLNANWSDGTFLRCYLETLHELTGKPILVSEFYCAATQNRSGNRNDSSIFPVVRSQTERAVVVKNTLTQLIRTPYVLGADWFQYADEPQHGRDDGENFDFGLVDTLDRPYSEITAAFAARDWTALKARTPCPVLDASAGVPPAPREPFADFIATHALRQWDRERGFVKSSSPNPLADLYLCWDRKALYLGVYALDITEDAYYRDRSIPKNDRALWVVQVPGQEALRIRVGAGREPLPSNPTIQIQHLSGVNLVTRSVTAVALPAGRFGRKAFKAGDRIEFTSTFLTQGRCDQMDWKGAFVLAR